ncbi:MAG: hypothetical protein DRH97_00415 [Chloroflexi bacterium]|nr:MAG: hypothetical protein DRH97_00415 [Chloroflexota bacterium]
MQFELTKVNDVFADFRKQLEEAKEINKNTVFDYEDKKSHAQAVSHIYKLRQTASAIDKLRKSEKAESLAYGKEIDLVAKLLEAEIREMIAVHDAPIQAKKEREAAVKKEISDRIERVIVAGNTEYETSEAAKVCLLKLKEIKLDDSFGAFKGEAAIAKDEAIGKVELRFDALVKSEATAIELARVNKENEEKARIEAEAKAKKDQEEREANIAKESRETAEREAKEREEKTKAEQAAALAKVEQDKKDAVAKAEREAQEKIAAEKKRIADEKAEADKIQMIADQKEKRRIANRAHQGRINSGIVSQLVELGCEQDLAVAIVKNAAKQEIQNLTINY